jgi:hypothetical protein
VQALARLRRAVVLTERELQGMRPGALSTTIRSDISTASSIRCVTRRQVLRSARTMPAKSARNVLDVT